MKSELISKTIPLRLALYSLLALCLIYIYFIGYVDDGYPNSHFARLGEKFSALQSLELFFVISILRRVDSKLTVRLLEIAVIMIGSFIIFAVNFRRPEYALALATIAPTIRYLRHKVVNAAIFSVAVFSFQYAGAFGPLFLLHKAFAYFDAAAIRSLLDMLGFAAGGSGTYIRYGATGMTLNVNVGCTSTLASIYAISGALIYIIYQKAHLNWQTGAAIVVLLIVITLINWMRIALMLESMAAYEFWHKGIGMQIVSLIDTIAILGIIHLGITHSADVRTLGHSI